MGGGGGGEGGRAVTVSDSTCRGNTGKHGHCEKIKRSVLVKPPEKALKS